MCKTYSYKNISGVSVKLQNFSIPESSVGRGNRVLHTGWPRIKWKLSNIYNVLAVPTNNENFVHIDGKIILKSIYK